MAKRASACLPACLPAARVHVPPINNIYSDSIIVV